MTPTMYLPSDGPTYRAGHNPTNHCRRKQHCNCTGRHRAKYGLPGSQCTCDCHKEKRRIEEEGYDNQ